MRFGIWMREKNQKAHVICLLVYVSNKFNYCQFINFFIFLFIFSWFKRLQDLVSGCHVKMVKLRNETCESGGVRVTTDNSHLFQIAMNRYDKYILNISHSLVILSISRQYSRIYQSHKQRRNCDRGSISYSEPEKITTWPR
jgi:hypothetical protein